MSNGFKVTPTKFRFGMSENGFEDFSRLVWAPSGPFFNDGINAKFHAFPVASHNCPGITDGRANVTYDDGGFKKVVGVGIDPLTSINGPERNMYYPKCPSNCDFGLAYVVACAGSGLGIRTFTGKDESNNPAFLQNKRVYSGSPFNQGIYISFPTAGEGMLPFAGPNSTLDCRSGQACAHILIDSATMQIQQKMSFTLKNIFGNWKSVEYSTSTLLAGIHSDKSTARMFVDGDQGGTVVIGGTIPEKNQEMFILDGGETYSCWTGRANTPTQNNIFGESPFRIEVTWEQFVTALNLAVEKTGKTHNELFGPNWEWETSWELTSARYAQEMHNPDAPFNNGSSGGRLKYFQIDAI